MNGLIKLADIDFVGGLALGITSAFAVLFTLTAALGGGFSV